MNNKNNSKVVCLECDRMVRKFYPMFFLDKEGIMNYGAICGKCHKIVSNRKIITLGHDAVRKPIDVAKEAINILVK